MLFVIKVILPLRIVESIWLQRLAYKLCPRVVFSSKKVFVKEVLPSLMQKTLGEYVQLALATCDLTIWILIFGCQKGFMTYLLWL